MTATTFRLDALSDAEIRDLAVEVRIAFARAHAKSVDLRRQIRELSAQLEASVEHEQTCLSSLNDLTDLLD